MTTTTHQNEEKAKKIQGGGTNQEGKDLDRQNEPYSIVKNEEYEQRRAVERKRYHLRRKAYDKQDVAAVLWAMAVTAVIQAY